jgi:hypothetical protein
MKQRLLNNVTEDGQMFGLTSEICNIRRNPAADLERRNASALKSRNEGLEIGLQFESGGQKTGDIPERRGTYSTSGSSVELANIKNLFVQCPTSKDTRQTEELHTPVTYHYS